MISPPRRIRHRPDAQINIVPYIDVMLVLLVIFMMTTPIIEQGVEVDLPQADAKMVDFSEQQPTVISIDKDGRYYINSVDQENTNITNGEQLPLSRIAGRVRARLEVFPAMQVFVRDRKSVV